MERTIEVQGLVRKFGDFTAVNDISFDVRRGEVFGFLGPNGAGKSTTINVLCTLLRPTSGSARVGDHDVLREPDAVRRAIGMIFQEASLDDRLTGFENLRFHAMLYGVPRQQFQERAAEMLDMVELGDKAEKPVRTYSGGMKRRLEIARGLLHHPEVLFLDEPTIGLDPQTRRHIWDYLLRLRREKSITMFMTTHYMEEAEHCERIAVIDRGRIIALDSPEGLKRMVGGDIVTVRTADNEQAARLLEEKHALGSRPGPDGQLLVETEQGEQFIPRMMSTFARQGLATASVSLRRPTLEDVFIKLTGRAIREEEGDQGREDMRRRLRMRGGGRR